VNYCRGKCDKYHNTGLKGYSKGAKYCKNCEIWLPAAEFIMCPCCKGIIRAGPRTAKGKEIYRRKYLRLNLKAKRKLKPKQRMVLIP